MTLLPSQKTEGQPFAVSEGTNTRTQPWNRLITLLPVLIHPRPLHQTATKGPRGAVLIWPLVNKFIRLCDRQ